MELPDPLDPHEDDPSVALLLDGVTSASRREDAHTLIRVMGRATGQPPRLWRPSIIGFGSYHYVYPSGREGDAPVVGFAPRTAATTVYLMDGAEAHADLLARLGPHRTGRGCVYLKRLADVDVAVLEEIVRRSYVATVAGGTTA
jgi:hypothetical protein